MTYRLHLAMTMFALNIDLRPSLTPPPNTDPKRKKELQELLHRVFEWSGFHYELGLIIQSEPGERNLREAIAEFDKAIQLDQHDKAFPEYQIERGNAYMMLRNIYMHETSASGRTPAARKRKERIEEAESEAEKSYMALKKYSSGIDFRMVWGRYYAALEKFDAALGCFTDVLESLAKKKQSITDDTPQAAIDQKNIAGLEACVYCNMAVCHWACRDAANCKKALECYERAIQLDEDNYQIWYDRGLLMHDVGRHADAIESIDHAIKLCPSREKKEQMAAATANVESIYKKKS